jgi:hypothetical protein
MSATRSHPSRPAAKPVAELIAGSLDPLVRKRGLARAELMAWWPDIVGAAYARAVFPERISWPRDGKAATLVVRCDPAIALQFSYEADRVRERLNNYFGYPAVAGIRIVQQRIGTAEARERRAPPPAPIASELPQDVERRLAGLDEPLRDSLRLLGKGILAGS